MQSFQCPLVRSHQCIAVVFVCLPHLENILCGILKPFDRDLHLHRVFCKRWWQLCYHKIIYIMIYCGHIGRLYSLADKSRKLKGNLRVYVIVSLPWLRSVFKTSWRKLSSFWTKVFLQCIVKQALLPFIYHIWWFVNWSMFVRATESYIHWTMHVRAIKSFQKSLIALLDSYGFLLWSQLNIGWIIEEFRCKSL